VPKDRELASPEFLLALLPVFDSLTKLFLLYRVVVGYALQSRVATMSRRPQNKIPQYWQSQRPNPIVAPISSNTGTEINHGSVDQGYPDGSLPRVLADDVCSLK
jgi:hypothetical protein